MIGLSLINEGQEFEFLEDMCLIVCIVVLYVSHVFLKFVLNKDFLQLQTSHETILILRFLL